MNLQDHKSKVKVVSLFLIVFIFPKIAAKNVVIIECYTLREKCPNTELFLVRIWTLFTQWYLLVQIIFINKKTLTFNVTTREKFLLCENCRAHTFNFQKRMKSIFFWTNFFYKKYPTKYVWHLTDTLVIFRSSRPEVFCKKGFLKISQNSQENTCARVSFLIKLRA